MSDTASDNPVGQAIALVTFIVSTGLAVLALRLLDKMWPRRPKEPCGFEVKQDAGTTPVPREKEDDHG